MSEEILYIDDGELVYYINENEFITCDEIPRPMLKGIKQLQQKADRLNNIINELEKYIIGETELNNGALLCGLSSDTEKDQYGIENNIYDNILDKLKALKENK